MAPPMDDSPRASSRAIDAEEEADEDDDGNEGEGMLPRVRGDALVEGSPPAAFLEEASAPRPPPGEPMGDSEDDDGV